MSESDRDLLFVAAHRVGTLSGKLYHQADLTHGEIMMFHHVKRMQGSEGIRASELGRHLGISRPGTSHLLTALENKGLIERVTSKKDRRAVNVRLTDCGLERYQSMNAQIMECVDRVMVRLGHEKTSRLTILLNELADIMEEEVKACTQKK